MVRASVYTVPGTPARVTFSRNGGTLYFQPSGQSAVALEAASETQFKIPPAVVFDFDAAKGEMTVTRGGQKRVFTKEK